MTRTLPGRLVILSLAVCFCGCAVVGDRQRLNRFQTAEKTYRRLLVRSELESALRLVDPAWRRTHPVDRAALALIRVTDCVVKDFTVSEDQMAVTQILAVRYYRTDRYIEKVIQARQEWRYNETDGTWTVTNGLPPFE